MIGSTVHVQVIMLSTPGPLFYKLSGEPNKPWYTQVQLMPDDTGMEYCALDDGRV